MTTTLHRLAIQHPSAETIPPHDLEPIFTELARSWEAKGRLVPGRPDEEWNRLSRYRPMR
ncbi:hypothetical protein [Streptomyces sp. NPDC060194]|uniref:hypothetical protein n=1 Tax=Streptomyces sp. NPDC060194 TaxID=3347069 RepID=UPI003652B322